MINRYQLGWRDIKLAQIARERQKDNILLLIALLVFLIQAYFIY